MRNKRLLALAVVIIAALASAIACSRVPSAQAQSSGSAVQLTITGDVLTPLNLTMDQIKAMPQTTEYAVLYCVDAPTTPLEQGYWTGVPLSSLLQLSGVSSAAYKVAYYAPDGFSTDFPVSYIQQNPQILIAWEENNQSLGELVQVAPGHWGYKWITDVTQIQLVSYDFFGTYENIGYPDDGTTGVQSQAPFSFSNGNSGYTPFPTITPTPGATAAPTSVPSLSPSPGVTPTGSPTGISVQPGQTPPFLYYVLAAAVIVAVSAAVAGVVLSRRGKRRPEEVSVAEVAG